MSLQVQTKVAVIDDDPSIRTALIRLLASLECDAEGFDSAESFLAAAPTSKAGCLVVDINLGDISGIELARQLVAEGYKFPIIFMTALDDEKFRHQAEAAGCVALLHKPFTAALLIGAINRATGWWSDILR